jgi:hypothetical protein
MKTLFKYLLIGIILFGVCLFDSCASASLINEHELYSSVLINKKINNILVLIDCHAFFNNESEFEIVVSGEKYNLIMYINNVLKKTNMFNEINVIENNQSNTNNENYDYIVEINFTSEEKYNKWVSGAWLVSLTLFPWISEEKYNATMNVLKSKNNIKKSIKYEDGIKVFHHISSPVIALFTESDKSLRRKVHESIISKLFNDAIEEGVFND